MVPCRGGMGPPWAHHGHIMGTSWAHHGHTHLLDQTTQEHLPMAACQWHACTNRHLVVPHHLTHHIGTPLCSGCHDGGDGVLGRHRLGAPTAVGCPFLRYPLLRWPHGRAPTLHVTCFMSPAVHLMSPAVHLMSPAVHLMSPHLQSCLTAVC